jgi:DNA polymerase IV
LTTLCRACSVLDSDVPPGGRCGACGSPRLISHRQLSVLAIAHVDCDAFYATVEKRSRPELADRPVIIGGGARGVVLACCYVARLYGVRSAMPTFKVLAMCPDAVVIRPDMAKYQEVGQEVRALMRRLTPLVEPLSIDEAFLDLSGTEVLHGSCPAQLLSALAKDIETTLGITVSIGLSDNKFLAKIASDLDKPRGFAILSRSEAHVFFADKPVSLLWGVGAAMQRRLSSDGITLIGQLTALGDRELATRYSRIGARIARLARGEDDRAVLAHSRSQSISAETTLVHDEADAETLASVLWPLCEKVSARLKQSSLAAGTVTLKLKTADFRLRTRSRRVADATQLASTLFQVATGLLSGEADGVTRFRLIGVGADALIDSRSADPPTLFDRTLGRPKRLEQTIDRIRESSAMAPSNSVETRQLPGSGRHLRLRRREKSVNSSVWRVVRYRRAWRVSSIPRSLSPCPATRRYREVACQARNRVSRRSRPLGKTRA